eukprot:1598783-Prymnesium_polylepis.1
MVPPSGSTQQASRFPCLTELRSWAAGGATRSCIGHILPRSFRPGSARRRTALIVPRRTLARTPGAGPARTGRSRMRRAGPELMGWGWYREN